ncbi:MAG: ImmA/IrrE family metallo-endopeptidase [Bauldia sp.]
MAHTKTIEELAELLLREVNCDSVPVPVDRIAKQLGARLRYAPLDEELSGMIFIRDGTPIIGVNSLHHSNRQRFTIAHEIAHLRLHPELITSAVHVDKGFAVPVLRRDSLSAQGTEKLEIDANQFAAALLMPKRHLIAALAKLSGDIDDDEPLQDMARKFKVSVTSLHYRMRNLTSDIRKTKA